MFSFNAPLPELVYRQSARVRSSAVRGGSVVRPSSTLTRRRARSRTNTRSTAGRLLTREDLRPFLWGFYSFRLADTTRIDSPTSTCARRPAISYKLPVWRSAATITWLSVSLRPNRRRSVFEVNEPNASRPCFMQPQSIGLGSAIRRASWARAPNRVGASANCGDAPLAVLLATSPNSGRLRKICEKRPHGLNWQGFPRSTH